MKHPAFLPVLLVLVCLSCQSRTTFYLGADISGTTELEQRGVQLYNAAGEPRENTFLMHELGLNAIRLRVWVHPQNREFRQDSLGNWIGVVVPPMEGHHPWSSKEDVLDMALRAKALDMPVMIDFHYSDWWADPHKQNIPEAWQNLSYEQIRDSATAHTRDVLQLLRQHRIDVRWIQIGNETTHGFLWPVARAEENMANYASITDACYAAAKSVYPKALCIVHIDCGSDMKRYRFILNGLRTYNARYDMVGMSMYPYWDQQEQGLDNEDSTLYRIQRNIETIYRDYGRETMITEFGYESWREDSGYDYTLKSIRVLRDSTHGHCHGIFYWAPELEIGYPLGAFRHHRPTRIMDAFRDSQS